MNSVGRKREFYQKRKGDQFAEEDQNGKERKESVKTQVNLNFFK